jgi:hypothetical protein
MLGYCEALLVGLEEVAGINDPQLKSRPAGLIQALRSTNNTRNTEILRVDGGEGHRVDVRVRRLLRSRPADTRTAPSCDPILTPVYNEQTVTISNYRETAVAVSWEEISRYCREASNLVSNGQRIPGAPNTPMMRDHLRKVMAAMNGLRQAVNLDVWAALAGSFGWNGVTLSSAPKPVNLLRASLDNAKIEEGLQDLMYDMAYNEVEGAPIVVGAGIFHRFNTSIQYGCCNLGGFDWKGPSSETPYEYWLDWSAQTALGNNQFAVLAPGAAQLLTFNRYRGTFVGRHGTSDFGVLPDPYLTPGEVPWAWDLQLRFEDCGPNARRYTAVVGITFGLYALPATSFPAGDPLSNVNGIFRYLAQIKP